MIIMHIWRLPPCRGTSNNRAGGGDEAAEAAAAAAIRHPVKKQLLHASKRCQSQACGRIGIMPQSSLPYVTSDEYVGWIRYYVGLSSEEQSCGNTLIRPRGAHAVSNFSPLTDAPSVLHVLRSASQTASSASRERGARLIHEWERETIDVSIIDTLKRIVKHDAWFTVGLKPKEHKR